MWGKFICTLKYDWKSRKKKKERSLHAEFAWSRKLSDHSTVLWTFRTRIPLYTITATRKQPHHTRRYIRIYRKNTWIGMSISEVPSWFAYFMYKVHKRWRLSMSLWKHYVSNKYRNLQTSTAKYKDTIEKQRCCIASSSKQAGKKSLEWRHHRLKRNW